MKSCNRTLDILDLLREPFTIKELAFKLNITYHCARKYVFVLNQRGRIIKIEEGRYIVR